MNPMEPDDFPDFGQMAEDAAAAAEASASSSDALTRITTLAELLIEQTATVARLEAELKTAQELARRTEEVDIPELMRELNLEKFTLADGSEVSLVDEVQCYISEDRKPEAFAWLADHGLDGVIKTAITVSFGKDERTSADILAELVKAQGYTPELKESIHPQTLKALMREQLAEGVDVPRDPFGLRPYSKAKVKQPTLAAAKRMAIRRKAGLK
jgi:hypothetical protein